MPTQSPAKDLRKTFAGALFGRGREMGSAQPTESPSQGLCSGRGAKWAQNSPPKDLEKPFKGRCAVADPVSRYSGASGQKQRGAPVIRMLPLFGKRTPARDRKGARGSVRAMPEHSTCRDGLLTSTTRTAIHVVHVGFGLVGTVVFLVGTSLDFLSAIDRSCLITAVLASHGQFCGVFLGGVDVCS